MIIINNNKNNLHKAIFFSSESLRYYLVLEVKFGGWHLLETPRMIKSTSFYIVICSLNENSFV